MGNTFIASGRNLIKTSERIDTFGNVIDPRTKQILTPVEKPYVPTAAELSRIVTPQVISTSNASPMDIQAQIEQAEKVVVALKEVKRLKIAEMRAQLEALEA